MTRFRIDRFVRYSTAITIALLMVSAPARSTDREALRERVAELSSTQNPMVDGAPIATLRGNTKLYELRSWEPGWTDPSMVRQLFEGVLRSAEHGLNRDDFHAHQLGARLDAGPAAGDPIYRADTEILCSDVFARLLVTLRFGKLDPSSFDTAWNFSREISNQDPVLAINGVLQGRQVSGAFEMAAPGVPKFELMRQALVTYQDIGARGGWPAVPEGDGMKLGSTGPRVVSLRDRLRVTGDLDGPASADPEIFDEQLEAAVRRFQRRHGIVADGAVGPRSLEEFNVPVEERIDQVIASRKTTRVNLEKPVTVMLLYWTTDVDKHGTVSFYNDVCSRDARVIRGLDEPFRIDPPQGAQEAVDGRVSPGGIPLLSACSEVERKAGDTNERSRDQTILRPRDFGIAHLCPRVVAGRG